MINSSKQRYLFAVDGLVNETAGSEILGKGQLMVADAKKHGNGGGLAPALNLSAIRKNEKRLKLLVGEDKKSGNRSWVSGSAETEVFSLSQIREIRYSLPKNLKQEVDEYIIGWTGRLDEAGTSLSFNGNSRPFNISLKVEGGQVPYSGAGQNSEELNFAFTVEDLGLFDSCSESESCDAIPCQTVTTNIVERLNKLYASAGRLWSDYIEVEPVLSCADAPASLTEMFYYTLKVCDTGDANALSVVQSQYPTLPIKRLSRKGAITTYQTIAETAPIDFAQTTVEVIPTCSVCPSGWDTVAGGFVYVVTVHDNGTDESSDIDTALGATNVTVSRQGSESGSGIGVYSVLATNAITNANIDDLVTAFESATISLVGEKDTICVDDSTSTYAWTEGEECAVATEVYEIVLPDTKCGTNRLSELQAAYPDLTIALGYDLVSYALTLTGSSGTATIAIGEDSLTATYGTSLTVTASNFVTANATALALEGVTLTGSGAVLTIIAPASEAKVTITNVTGNLNGTIDSTIIPDTSACTTRYTAEVETGLVCEDCDPVFDIYYSSEAPEMYDGVQWNLLTPATEISGDCLCGIKIKAKPFKLDPDSRHFYKYPFVESSPNLYVSAGWVDTENFGTFAKGKQYPANIRQKSYKKDRDMLFGDLLPKVRNAHAYNHGFATGFDAMADDFSGFSFPFSSLGNQAVQFSIDIEHDRLQQGFQSSTGKVTTVNIFVEYGKHDTVLAKLNELASAAGKQVMLS